MAKIPPTRLVAARVSKETSDVLQVGMVVTGATSMQELLKPVVDEYAAALLAEPEVQEILKRAQSFRDRKAGVDRLPKRRRSG